MYRVELKEEEWDRLLKSQFLVPNVPCGVESWEGMLSSNTVAKKVPNVPCGVERASPIVV